MSQQSLLIEVLYHKISYIRNHPQMYGRDLEEVCRILITLLEVVYSYLRPSTEYDGWILKLYLEKIKNTFPNSNKGASVSSTSFKDERSLPFIENFVDDVISHFETEDDISLVMGI